MSQLRSRKLWMSLVTAALVVANRGLGLNLPEESVLAVAGIAVSYVLGQGAVDAARELARK